MIFARRTLPISLNKLPDGQAVVTFGFAWLMLIFAAPVVGAVEKFPFDSGKSSMSITSFARLNGGVTYGEDFGGVFVQRLYSCAGAGVHDLSALVISEHEADETTFNLPKTSTSMTGWVSGLVPKENRRFVARLEEECKKPNSDLRGSRQAWVLTFVKGSGDIRELFYLDAATVAARGDVRYVWALNVLGRRFEANLGGVATYNYDVLTAEGYLKLKHQIDCEQSRLKITDMVRYGEDGGVQASTAIREDKQKWMAATPGTPGMEIVAVACGMR